MSNLGDIFPIEQSSLYQRYLLEQKEIDKVKWVESERIGVSVTREYAEWVWVTRHRNQWLRYIASGQST